MAISCLLRDVRMRPACTLLLVFLMFAAGLAQAYDRHAKAGCLDLASPALAESVSRFDPNRTDGSLCHFSGISSRAIHIARNMRWTKMAVFGGRTATATPKVTRFLRP